MIIKCKNCNKKFEVFPSAIKKYKYRKNGRKFCSRTCCEKYRTIIPKAKICEFCGKKYTPKLNYYSKKQKYCSNKCQLEAKNISHRITIKCANCNKELIIPKFLLKKGKRFCSLKCFYLAKGKTRIEELIYKRLKLFKIKFKYQESISYWFVDFLLPKKIIFEADGDYWHNLKEQKIKDIIKDKKLRKIGFKIYRFSEKDILDSLGRCIDFRLKKMKIVKEVMYFAVLVSEKEGGKINLNISQIKEVLKVVNELVDGELYKIIRKK